MSLLSKIILIFLCSATVMAGFIVFYAKESASSRPEAKPHEIMRGDTTITMTPDGFIPDRIHIARGTRVRFMNTDTLAHWPASDLHPSHGIYPLFDPRTPIAPGEEWVFTFDKIGVWHMHDHLSPYIIGTITVVE